MSASTEPVSLTDLKAKRSAMTQGEWERMGHTLVSPEYDVGRCDAWADAEGIVATHNDADVLIEIAEAALAMKQAGQEGDEVIAMMGAASSSDDYAAACTLAPRVEERRRDALRRLDAALAKITT